MKKKVKVIIRRKLPIGQTLETSDEYLPIDKKHSQQLKKSRPVIIADKQNGKHGKEEYLVIPTSTQKTNNTTYYGKHGIKCYRHNIEIEDNEGNPIILNKKFKRTKNTTVLPIKDVKDMLNKVVNHTKQSSVNRKKIAEFKTRNKKKKG